MAQFAQSRASLPSSEPLRKKRKQGEQQDEQPDDRVTELENELKAVTYEWNSVKKAAEVTDKQLKDFTILKQRFWENWQKAEKNATNLEEKLQQKDAENEALQKQVAALEARMRELQENKEEGVEKGQGDKHEEFGMNFFCRPEICGLLKDRDDSYDWNNSDPGSDEDTYAGVMMEVAEQCLIDQKNLESLNDKMTCFIKSGVVLEDEQHDWGPEFDQAMRKIGTEKEICEHSLKTVQMAYATAITGLQVCRQQYLLTEAERKHRAMLSEFNTYISFKVHKEYNKAEEEKEMMYVTKIQKWNLQPGDVGYDAGKALHFLTNKVA